MNILIDGMDLSGKTTLARGLVKALQARGWRVRRSVGTDRRSWLDAWAGWLYRRRPPGCALVSGLFALATAVSSLRSRRPRGCEVVVQEAGVEHSLAFAEVFRRRLAALVLRGLRRRGPHCDLRIYLAASAHTRRARYQRRPHNDAIDAMLWRAPERFESIERRLRELLLEAGAVEIETDRASPQQVLSRVLGMVDRVGARLAAVPSSEGNAPERRLSSLR